MSLAVWPGCKCWEMSVAINAVLAGWAGPGWAGQGGAGRASQGGDSYCHYHVIHLMSPRASFLT